MPTLERQWSTTGVVAQESLRRGDGLTNGSCVEQVPGAALGRKQLMRRRPSPEAAARRALSRTAARSRLAN